MDPEPTVELEVFPEPGLNPAGGEMTAPPEVEVSRLDAAAPGAGSAGGSDRESTLRSKVVRHDDAIETVLGELDQVRALAESLRKDVRGSEDVIKVLAHEVKSMTMKQHDTEELLGLCRSEIERLKSQLFSSDEAGGASSSARRPELSKILTSAPKSTAVAENPADASIAPDVVADVMRGQARSTDARPSSMTAIPVEDEPLGVSGPVRTLVMRKCSTPRLYPLGAGSMRLGSSPENDIPINSNYVSRHHAEFINSGTECILKDLDSTNGTFVNSRRVKRCVLQNGDWIAIGKHRFEFVEQDGMPGSRKS